MRRFLSRVVVLLLARRDGVVLGRSLDHDLILGTKTATLVCISHLDWTTAVLLAIYVWVIACSIFDLSLSASVSLHRLLLLLLVGERLAVLLVAQSHAALIVCQRAEKFCDRLLIFHCLLGYLAIG